MRPGKRSISVSSLTLESAHRATSSRTLSGILAFFGHLNVVVHHVDEPATAGEDRRYLLRCVDCPLVSIDEAVG